MDDQEIQEAPAAKIGQGHAMGMLRLGGHELTQALAAFPESNIRPQEEMGVFGNTTTQHVNEQMYEAMLDNAAGMANQPSKDHDIER